MSTWEQWQEEYRWGVLLIFPPEPIRSVVNSLRGKYDPRSHGWCDAHISLTVPAPRPLTEELLRDLDSVASRWKPLRIRYGPPMVFPSHPGVTLPVEPQADLRRLVGDFEAAPPFRGAGPRRWPFTPHMTIAEFVSGEESARIMAELRGRDLVGEFTCTSVSLAVPDDAFRFTERRRLRFGSAASEGLP